jgi:hypothetical protein
MSDGELIEKVRKRMGKSREKYKRGKNMEIF